MLERLVADLQADLQLGDFYPQLILRLGYGAKAQEWNEEAYEGKTAKTAGSKDGSANGVNYKEPGEMG